MTDLQAIPLLTRMFYFLRHGETENNRRRLIAGSLDGELEDKPRATRMSGVTPPGAETPQQYIERTAAGLASIPAVDVPLIVAHSGTYRVLCRLLGHDDGAEPITNCRPVRFMPPTGGMGAWRVEML